MEKLNNIEVKNLAGENIREVRSSIGMTQEMLSSELEKLGVSMKPSTLSKIETKKRSITDIELAAFSEVFGIDISKLIKK